MTCPIADRSEINGGASVHILTSLSQLNGVLILDDDEIVSIVLQTPNITIIAGAVIANQLTVIQAMVVQIQGIQPEIDGFARVEVFNQRLLLVIIQLMVETNTH